MDQFTGRAAETPAQSPPQGAASAAPSCFGGTFLRLPAPSVQARSQYLWQLSLLAALYFLIAKIALLAAIPPGYATSIWPPSGIALAVILLYGSRMWPAIWIGSALTNLTVHSSPAAAVLMSSGNLMEALVGAALIRRVIGVPHQFQRGEDVFKFVGLSAASCFIGATIGTVAMAVVAGLAPKEVLAGWWTWWQGDATGMIVVAPLILAWSTRSTVTWTSRSKAEVISFWIVLLLVSYLALGGDPIGHIFLPLLLLLTLPLVNWAALRFPQREVVAAIAVLCSMAVGFTVSGRGPLASSSLDRSLLQLLVFIGTVSVTGLSVSAVASERRRFTLALHDSHSELERRVFEQTWNLRKSDETLRLLVEGIQDYAIFMLDQQGKVMTWNKGAQTINGYTANEIIGEHFSRLFPPDAIARHQPERELALAKEHGRYEDEDWRVRKDGTRFWANVTLTPIYDQQGQFRGFAKVTRDMTASKHIESLEQRERHTNEFLAMLGHELRNPLAAARNALSLMGMRSANEATRDWSRSVIDRQIAQLTRLVDDLLDIARIGSGKIELKRERIELNSTVLRAVESCRPTAQARQQILEVHTWKEDLLIDGDVTRISQIVLNLLNNAIKYTPAGGRVTVSVTLQGDQALLRILDTGVGISSELLPKVFELFVQGERSLAGTEGGLGIGLTIVQKLVALHGGSVTARSDGPGKGSEFSVLLPAWSRRPSHEEAVTPWQPSKASVKRRVLIVDDNRDMAESAAAILAASGHEVRTAYDGPAALSRASDFLPDVVLLDIGLPGISGYEVARQLRASGGRHAVLVAVTGYGQEADRRQSRDAGFDHHLVKPLEPAALEKIIESTAPPAPEAGARAVTMDIGGGADQTNHPEP